MKVGLIGLGGVGALHLRSFLAHPDLMLTAVAEPRGERLEELELPPELARFNDHAELLASGLVDVVCVATPCASHESIVIDCARAAVHAMCEKPLALTRESARRMLEACQDAGVALGYGSSYRFLPAIVMARDIIQSGQLGTVRIVSERAIGRAGIHSKPYGFAHYPEGGPGGGGIGLVDHGIHMIDIFPWMLGTTIDVVEGQGNLSGGELAPEWMTMRFANGASGHLLYDESVYGGVLPGDGQFARGEGWDIDGAFATAGQWSANPVAIIVNGTDAALKIFPYANRVFMQDAQGVRELAVEGPPPPQHFGMQMAAFVAALERGDPPPVPAECGLDALGALLDVYGI